VSCLIVSLANLEIPMRNLARIFVSILVGSTQKVPTASGMGARRFVSFEELAALRLFGYRAQNASGPVLDEMWASLMDGMRKLAWSHGGRARTWLCGPGT
jgi:hypothetical protein